MILTMVLISCQTLPKEKIEIEWSTFPDPIEDGISVVVYDEENDKVTMPFTYWQKIVKYVIDTEKNIEILENLE